MFGVVPAANLPSCHNALPCLPIICIAYEGGIFIAFGFGRLTRDPSVLRYHRLKIKPLLSSAMVFNQIGQPRQRVSLHGAFSELDALSGSKTEQQADRASYGSVTVAHHPVPKPTQLKPLCEQGFHISRNREKHQVFLLQRAVSAISRRRYALHRRRFPF